jgi:hypothetical protein
MLTPRSVRKLLLPTFSLPLLAPLVLSGLACGGSTSAAGSDVAFKTATVNGATAGAGVTNIISLSFIAPSNGFVWASASGSCGVTQPLPVDSIIAVQIETSPTARDPTPGDAEFEIAGGGASPQQGSYEASRALAVSAGANTVDLNIDNPSSGGIMSCSATLLVVFSTQQLH